MARRGRRAKVEMRGLPELERALEQLGDPKRAVKLLRSSVRTGAKILQAEMAKRAPRGTRTTGVQKQREGQTVRLGQSIIITRTRPFGALRLGKTRAASTSVFIGPSPRAWWAHFVEFGTKFMAARPFMRPAIAAKERAAVEKIRTTLGKKIDREARRLARGA